MYALRARKAVFGGTWQMVGRAEQVAEPGSFLTAEVAGEPILVVRGDDGTLRAFYNVCRHRAAPVLNEPCGTATKLRCRYHGWTYDLAGQLRGTPEFDGVADFRQGGQRPAAGRRRRRGGRSSGSTSSRRAQPLDEFLAPLPERSTAAASTQLKFAGPARVRPGVQLEGVRR